MLALCLLIASQAGADITRDAANRLCVDVVVVERGRDIRGVIVSRDNDGGASVAVRRGWLRTEQPEVYEEFRVGELRSQQQGNQQLIERIDAWIVELDPNEEGQLIGILETERNSANQRIDNPDAAADDQEFLLIDIEVDRIHAIYVQQPRQRQAGLCAYHFDLADVETTILPDVESQLNELDADWRTMTVDLTHRLAARGEQSDKEWAARQALFEFQFGTQVAFQGTGDAIVRVDSTGQGDVGDALSQILGGGLTVDVGDLLDLPELGGTRESNRWREHAIAITAEEGARGCRVTRVAPDLVGRTSTVEETFLARMPDGTWETIWSASITSRPGDVPEGAVDLIREDPQVQQIITTAELLGIGTVDLNQALTFGAVTMQAQNQANGQFRQFLDRYLQQLDGPPLVWGER